jgi:hypothetical protein
VTVDEGSFLHCGLGGAERERISKSRMREAHRLRRRPFKAVLEFEILSRKIASKPSMKSRR